MVQYRLTASREALPQVGVVVHACGLTHWHMVVQEVVHLSPQQEDGTVTVHLMVDRWDIGKEEGPCALCGITWMEKQNHR